MGSNMLARLPLVGMLPVYSPCFYYKNIHTLPAVRQKFDEMVNFRKNEARASIVVQVGNPSKSVALVDQVCSKHGKVNNVFHYSIKDKELLLLELDSETAVMNLLASCSHNSNQKVIPSASPFLWLRAMPSEMSTINHSPQVFNENNAAINNLEEFLSTAKSLSHQMVILEDQTRLSEIGCRLRWITCIQIERMLSGLFPNMQILPFGSFVNGCGRYGCDLDMAVSLDGNSESHQSHGKSPLVFHAKAAINNPRLQTQKHIEILADILQNFTTGCTQVQRVLQARVPIVKFHHEFTGVDCDISIGSLTGVFMSELLYLYGEMDWRFKPLVTTVRYWAAWVRLTDMVPSPRITNFTLTLLVVFHLQRCSPPILPTLSEMVKKSRPHLDRRQTNEVDCTFLRDPVEFQKRSQLNQDSLEDLFLGFLRFIESFDFSERSVSIITGNAMRKIDSKPLHVQNPLERELNVSRNVNLKELTRLVMEARNALYILETREGQDKAKWGLLALPRAENMRKLGQKIPSHFTQLDIKDLFTNISNEEEISGLNEIRPQEHLSVNKTSSPETTRISSPIEEPLSSLNGFINHVHRNVGQKPDITKRNVQLKSEKQSQRMEKLKSK